MKSSFRGNDLGHLDKMARAMLTMSIFLRVCTREPGGGLTGFGGGHTMFGVVVLHGELAVP